MIRHGSIYDRDARQADDGLRVLVMRHWPRGVRRDRVDTWLRDAAPSRELLRAYNRGELTWDDFASRYRSQILDQRPDVLERIRELQREHGTLTLLCHERLTSDQHCHRELLIELLGEHADAAPPASS